MAGDLHLGIWRTVLKFIEVAVGFVIFLVYLGQWYGKKALNHFMDWRLVTATIINLAVLAFNGARLFERACKYCGVSRGLGVVLFTIAYLLATLVSLVLLIQYAKDEVLVSPTLFSVAVAVATQYFLYKKKSPLPLWASPSWTVGLAMGWTTFFFLGAQTPIMAIAFEDIRIGFPAMVTVVGSVIEPLYAFVKTVSAQTWEKGVYAVCIVVCVFASGALCSYEYDGFKPRYSALAGVSAVLFGVIPTSMFGERKVWKMKQ